MAGGGVTNSLLISDTLSMFTCVCVWTQEVIDNIYMQSTVLYIKILTNTTVFDHFEEFLKVLGHLICS